MKTCKKCGSTEFYSIKGCKPCARSRAAKYRSKNPEKVKIILSGWYINNVQRQKEYSAEYRLKNKEKIKEKKAASYILKADINRAYVAAWRKKNPNYIKEYGAANKDKGRIKEHNRRARKKSNGGQLSKGLAKKLFKLQHGKCACCGLLLSDNYHMDHIMPLVLGGKNEDNNIQLLTATCNLQKHAKHPIDFMQSRGFLL